LQLQNQLLQQSTPAEAVGIDVESAVAAVEPADKVLNQLSHQ